MSEESMQLGVSKLQTLDDWVLEHCTSSTVASILRLPDNLAKYGQSRLSQNDEYGYRYHDVKPFLKTGAEILATKGLAEYQKYYWTDFSRTVDAYRVISNWRFSDMLEATIRCLNSRDYVPAGVLARSTLELSAVYFDNSTFFFHNLRGIIASLKSRKPTEIVLSEDFENFSLRIIWGTRIGDPSEELKQTNAFGVIKRLAKFPDYSELLANMSTCAKSHTPMSSET
jgi:hypothetical protein